MDRVKQTDKWRKEYHEPTLRYPLLNSSGYQHKRNLEVIYNPSLEANPS